MAHVEEHAELELSSPVLVEGLPGVGLVGKIAADHLVESLEMTHYASCHCEGLPDVATYREGAPTVQPPVRIYADEDRDLLVLQSDVPVSPSSAKEFAGCLTGWLQEHSVTPVYLSGLATEKEGVPEMYGIATGGGSSLLDDHGIDVPDEGGLVSGPTGSLLAAAGRTDLTGVGLIVQANKQFPDPEAARVLLVHGIQPIAGIEVDTEKLVDQAEEIAQAREQLAQRMSQAGDESSQAQPTGMFQ